MGLASSCNNLKLCGVQVGLIDLYPTGCSVTSSDFYLYLSGPYSSKMAQADSSPESSHHFKIRGAAGDPSSRCAFQHDVVDGSCLHSALEEAYAKPRALIVGRPGGPLTFARLRSGYHPGPINVPPLFGPAFNLAANDLCAAVRSVSVGSHITCSVYGT